MNRGIMTRLQGRLHLPSLRDDKGQGLVEYALIISVVALGTIAALVFLRDEIKGLFSKAGSSIQVAAGPSSGGPPVGGGTPPVYSSGSTLGCGGGCDDGDTVTVNPGTWTGTAPITFAYAWASNPYSSAACNADPGYDPPGGQPNENWVPFGGNATTATVPNPSGNGTDTLRVIITASNGSGSAQRVLCTDFDH